MKKIKLDTDLHLIQHLECSISVFKNSHQHPNAHLMQIPLGNVERLLEVFKLWKIEEMGE